MHVDDLTVKRNTGVTQCSLKNFYAVKLILIHTYVQITIKQR